MLGEKRAWTEARNQRLSALFPEFAQADARGVMGADAVAVSQGRPPSAFSQMAMRLASEAAGRRQQ